MTIPHLQTGKPSSVFGCKCQRARQIGLPPEVLFLAHARKPFRFNRYASGTQLSSASARARSCRSSRLISFPNWSVMYLKAGIDGLVKRQLVGEQSVVISKDHCRSFRAPSHHRVPGNVGHEIICPLGLAAIVDRWFDLAAASNSPDRTPETGSFDFGWFLWLWQFVKLAQSPIDHPRDASVFIARALFQSCSDVGVKPDGHGLGFLHAPLVIDCS